MKLPARVTVVSALATAAATAVLAVATPAAAQSVWVAPSTQKIRPGDATGSATSATLEAAGNELEAFHLVVFGGAAGARAVTVSAAPLVGDGGATIDDVRVYREGWYTTTTASYQTSPLGRWPDAMIPDVDALDGQKRNAFPCDVPAGEQQPIFVEYHVPPRAPAGWYRGVVHVAGGVTADVPVQLYVHAFTLPSTASIRTAFGIGYDDACVAHFGGYTQCGGDAGVVALMAKYARLALDHRISLSDVVAITPLPKSDGSFDWSAWDAAYGPLLDGTLPGRLAGARLTSLRYIWTADQAHYTEWARHLRQKGWFDRTFDYACDEPPAGCAWSDIAPHATMVHAADPAFDVLVTTSIELATAYGVAASIDTLVAADNLLDPMPPGANLRASYDPWLAASPARQLWLYHACDSHDCTAPGGPDASTWPSYMIDGPASLNRALEWQAWRERASGELYYDTTYAFTRGDAWTNQYYFGGNGDGTLFYPGTPAKIGGTSNIPVASLRLKLIREGQEDYEYFALLAALGDRDTADREAATLSPHAYANASDPAAIDAARHRMALRIEALSGQTPPPMVPGDGSGAPSDGPSSPSAMPPGGVGGAGAVAGASDGARVHGGCSAAATRDTADDALAMTAVALTLCLWSRARRPAAGDDRR